MLWRTLAVALLLLSACSPAGAQSTSAPLADPVTPADAMTPTEDSVPTAVPDAAPADTPAPTVEAVSALTVPTPAIVADAWVPLPRSKTSGCAIQAGLPDSACTPGALDARVNQSDLGTTVCSRGYTATVRPPVNVTEKIKRDQMAAYGLTGARLADYELDHLISLELGGAPADVANLWPEPWTGDGNAHQKDAVENEANRAVCSGRIALSDAQRQIAQDWLAFGRVLGALP